jgi:hypothetical protein
LQAITGNEPVKYSAGVGTVLPTAFAKTVAHLATQSALPNFQDLDLIFTRWFYFTNCWSVEIQIIVTDLLSNPIKQASTGKPPATAKTVVSRKRAKEILLSRTYQEKILASLHISPNGYFKNKTIGDLRFGYFTE